MKSFSCSWRCRWRWQTPGRRCPIYHLLLQRTYLLLVTTAPSVRLYKPQGDEFISRACTTHERININIIYNNNNNNKKSLLCLMFLVKAGLPSIRFHVLHLKPNPHFIHIYNAKQWRCSRPVQRLARYFTSASCPFQQTAPVFQKDAMREKSRDPCYTKRTRFS